MRRAIGLFLILLVASCKDREQPRRVNVNVDASQLYNSAGEVSLTDGGSLEYSITSDKYRQWYTAQQGLDRRIASRYGALLQPSSPSERSIDRAVRYLASEPAAREAIERAGLSIREFVVTTVALEQEMRVASERGQADTMPVAVPYPSPLDSAYATSAYPAPAYPYPTTPYPTPTPYPYPATTPYPPTYTPYPVPGRLDSTRRVDTVYLPGRDSLRRDTLPQYRDVLNQRRDTVLPRRDTNLSPLPLSQPRRDSVSARRDSLLPRRDSIRPVPRRDTITPRRDTLRRDTLRPRPDTPRVDTLGLARP
jgi:hypothetical protein